MAAVPMSEAHSPVSTLSDTGTVVLPLRGSGG